MVKFIKGVEVVSENEIVKVMNLPQRENGCIYNNDVSVLSLNDGRLICAVRSNAWDSIDISKAKAIAIAYARDNGLRFEKDLSWAFETTGSYPGLQLIAGNLSSTPYEGAIVKTTEGRFFFIKDKSEE